MYTHVHIVGSTWCSISVYSIQRHKDIRDVYILYTCINVQLYNMCLFMCLYTHTYIHRFIHATYIYAWWRIGRVTTFRLEGRGFESHSSRGVGTLGKSFTYSCL